MTPRSLTIWIINSTVTFSHPAFIWCALARGVEFSRMTGTFKISKYAFTVVKQLWNNNYRNAGIKMKCNRCLSGKSVAEMASEALRWFVTIVSELTHFSQWRAKPCTLWKKNMFLLEFEAAKIHTLLLCELWNKWKIRHMDEDGYVGFSI